MTGSTPLLKTSRHNNDKHPVGKNIATLLNIFTASRRDLANVLEENDTLRSEAIKHSLECSTTSWEKRNVESALCNAMQRCRSLTAHQDHLGKELESMRMRVEESENARKIAIASLKSRHQVEKQRLEEEVANLVAVVEDKEREIGEIKSLLNFQIAIGNPSSQQR